MYCIHTHTNAYACIVVRYVTVLSTLLITIVPNPGTEINISFNGRMPKGKDDTFLKCTTNYNKGHTIRNIYNIYIFIVSNEIVSTLGNPKLPKHNIYFIVFSQHIIFVYKRLWSVHTL